MSQENVEVVRRLWDAVDRRDTATVLSLYHSEVEFDLSGFPAEARGAGTYRGHEGLARLFSEWREVWEDAGADVLEVIDCGDRVLSVYSYRGRGRASGVPIKHTFAVVWTIQDGRVVRVEWFVAREDALEAVGLRE